MRATEFTHAGDSYTYKSGGFSAGYTLYKNVSESSGTTSITYHKEAKSSTFVLYGLSSSMNGDNAAAGVLDYHEISSYEELKNYIGSDGSLKSGNYKIVDDIYLEKHVDIKSNVILDIAKGKKITFLEANATDPYPNYENYKGKYYKWKTGGTILIYVRSGGDFTVQGEGSIEAGKFSALGLFASGMSNPSANLTVNGDVQIISDTWYGISGNGTDTNWNTNLTINGGTILSKNAAAIYHPQKGTLVVNGGTITGYNTAVEVRAGELYVTDGTFNALSPDFEVSSNKSGTTTEGVAIAISQHTTKENLSVNITGGTFRAAVPIGIANPEENDAENNVKTIVTGGKFESVTFDKNGSGGTYDYTNLSYEVNASGNAIAAANTDDRVTFNIGGGTFVGGFSSTAAGASAPYAVFVDSEGKPYAKFNNSGALSSYYQRERGNSYGGLQLGSDFVVKHGDYRR